MNSSGTARAFAQFAAVVFLVAGVAGFFTGDASRVIGGKAGGNFDGVALHLTYARDVLNLLIAAVFLYAATIARERARRFAVLGAGAFLLLLAVVGFIVGDDDAGGHSIAGLHFTLGLNVLDLAAGALAVLCGLGEPGGEELTVSRSER